MSVVFSRYVVDPRALRPQRTSPAWLVDLAREATPAPVHPNDRGIVLVGDPRDGLDISIGRMRWGMPNLWLARKGKSPFDGPVVFLPLTKAMKTSPHGQRCLVPVTSFVLASGEELGSDVRPLLTLAALSDGVDQDGVWESGFTFLTLEVADGARRQAAALALAPEFHDEWLDGWKRTEDLKSACEPLLVSRLRPVVR